MEPLVGGIGLPKYAVEKTSQGAKIASPVSLSQPGGPGFQLNGHQVSWQNWTFHFRVSPRVGVVISDVRYRDGDRQRRVLYQGHLSELFEYDFAGEPEVGPFAGYFTSLFGLTATKVSLSGDGVEPAEVTPFPGYFLDFADLYRTFLPWPGRSVEQLRFRVRRDSADPVSLKVELKDEADFDVFARVDLGAPTGRWEEISLALPDGSSPGDFTDSIEGNGDPERHEDSQVVAEADHLCRNGGTDRRHDLTQ